MNQDIIKLLKEKEIVKEDLKEILLKIKETHNVLVKPPNLNNSHKRNNY
jgi:hypothetical protein